MKTPLTLQKAKYKNGVFYGLCICNTVGKDDRKPIGDIKIDARKYNKNKQNEIVSAKPYKHELANKKS